MYIRSSSDINHYILLQVRSALQILHNIGRGSQEISGVKNGRVTSGSGIITSSNTGAMTLSVNHQMSALTRSSPSIFITHNESDPKSLSAIPPPSPSLSSTSRLGTKYRHASTQTDLPIDVPVEVLEAFVLAHKDRVLQLLGIMPDTTVAELQSVSEQPAANCDNTSSVINYPTSPSSSPPVIPTSSLTFTTHTTITSICKEIKESSRTNSLNECTSVDLSSIDTQNSPDTSSSHDDVNDDSQNNRDFSIHGIDQYTEETICQVLETDLDKNIPYRPLDIKSVTSSQVSIESSEESSISDLRKTSDVPESKKSKKPFISSSYQLSNLFNWNPVPLVGRNKLNMVSSISTGGIKDILQNSHQLNYYSNRRDIEDPSSFTPNHSEQVNQDISLQNQTSESYTHQCVSEDSRGVPNISRSTSMPTSGYHFKKIHSLLYTNTDPCGVKDKGEISSSIVSTTEVKSESKQTSYATEC